MAACACADSFGLNLSGSPPRVLSLLSVREIFAPIAEILSENGRLEGEGECEPEFMRLVILLLVLEVVVVVEGGRCWGV